MIDPPCNKRQREIINGQEAHRCINKKAEEFKEIVNSDVCHACPVREFMKKRTPCAKKVITPRIKNPLPVLGEQEGYPPCPFRAQGVDALKCSITNLPVDQEICVRCDSITKQEERNQTAGNVQKGFNYFGAIRRWVANGRPRRSQEEIDKILKEHCQNGCERYDPKNHACKNCGCQVNDSADPLANKLVMATEHCPLGRF